jgi:cyclophilin family peptidyl-prolyl cis-trans isomerase/NADPH-dependent ferric siderophore reductase
VRARAAFALGLVGDSLAAPALVRRLPQERDGGARDAILTALASIGSHRDGVPEIAKSLHAQRAEERWAAALAAARCRDAALVGPLLKHADEARPEMRWRVAYALGRIGPPARTQGAPVLRTIVKDPAEIVRYHAARALGDVADSGATAALQPLLADKSWRVRVNAAHALGAVGASSAVRPLIERLRDPSAHVRWEAAISLGLLGDSTAAPALRRALADSASGVVQGAALSLLRLQGERAVPAVAPAMDLLPPFLRSGLIEALGAVPGPLALETLIARARDASDPPLAVGAASGLAQRRADSTAVVPVLRDLLGSAEFAVVASAAEGLGAFRDSASVPALAALLSRQGDWKDGDVRASAASALGEIGTAGARTALETARHDPEQRIRETACRALGLPPDSVGAGTQSTLRVETPYTGPVRRAVVKTERGVIEIELTPAAAPRTVENFLRLAKSGYFDGLAFHRVVPNFVIQTGCPRGDGWGGPGYEIPCEYNDRPYKVGTVGMALAGKDTGGSQWFITLSPQPRLEGRYTVFGQVVAGMDVAERIMPGDRIVKISVR